MKKRIQLDIFLEPEDFGTVQRDALDLITAKKKDIPGHKSTATVHDCGHDDGSKCKNVEVL